MNVGSKTEIDSQISKTNLKLSKGKEKGGGINWGYRVNI